MLDTVTDTMGVTRLVPAVQIFDNAEWPMALRRVFQREGITSFEQLAGMTRGDLRKLHGVGPRLIAVVREELEDRGLRLYEGRGPKMNAQDTREAKSQIQYLLVRERNGYRREYRNARRRGDLETHDMMKSGADRISRSLKWLRETA